jgi:hypothetical protein
MIITGGKYWAKAGSGAAKATSATPAANRTALVLTNARLVRDVFAGPRDLPAPARGGNPIWSRPNQSAYSRRPSVRRLATYTAAREVISSAPAPTGKRVILVLFNPTSVARAKRSTAATASRRMCARKSAAIMSVTEPARGVGA